MSNQPQNQHRNRESAIKNVIVEWVDEQGKPLDGPATDEEIHRAGEAMVLAAARALFPEAEVRMVSKTNQRVAHKK